MGIKIIPAKTANTAFMATRERNFQFLMVSILVKDLSVYLSSLNFKNNPAHKIIANTTVPIILYKKSGRL